jgi:hypothetical protein
MNEKVVNDILSKIEQLPASEQPKYLRELKDKLALSKKEVSPAIKMMRLMLSEAVPTHKDMLDNEEDVHPQYYNEDRLDPKLKALEIKLSEAEINLKLLHNGLLGKLDLAEKQLTELAKSTQSSSLLRSKFENEIKKKTTELSEVRLLAEKANSSQLKQLAEKFKSSQSDLDTLQQQVNSIREAILTIDKVEIEPGEHITVERKQKGNVTTYKINSTAKSITNIGSGGGGLILDQVYSQLNTISAGLSSLYGGISSLNDRVLRTGDSMSGPIWLTDMTGISRVGSSVLLYLSGASDGTILSNEFIRIEHRRLPGRVVEIGYDESNNRGYINHTTGANLTRPFEFRYINTAVAWLYPTGNLKLGSSAIPLSRIEADSAGFGITTFAGAAITLDVNHFTLLANAVGATMTVTLPSGISTLGRIYNVKKVDAGANTVRIVTQTNENIDGTSVFNITAQWTNLQIQSAGSSNWRIL